MIMDSETKTQVNSEAEFYKVDGCENQLIANFMDGEDPIFDIHIIEEDAEINEDFNNMVYDYLKNGIKTLNECAVTFIKKDGTERTMNISYSKLQEKLEEEKETISDSAKKASATRKANHPNLLPVFDVDAGIIKSINLDTLSYIKGVNTDKGIIRVKRTGKE